MQSSLLYEANVGEMPVREAARIVGQIEPRFS
jgi:hypothetical protein